MTSPWAGLGSLGLRGKTRTIEPSVDEDDDSFARPSIKRVVPATSAPSPFQHPYVPTGRAAGSADTSTDEPAADPTTEEMSMPRESAAPKPRKTKATKASSAQFQICSLLMAKGDLTRDELLADVSADRTAFNNAIFNAKAAGRIVFLEKEGKYRITATGRAWTSGGANLDNQRASPPPTKPTRRKGAAKAKAPKAKRQAKTPAPGTAPAPAAGAAVATTGPHAFQVVQERSFRCAVISDGGFFLAKNGQQIDLTPTEHAEMLRYLDRMADQPGA